MVPKLGNTLESHQEELRKCFLRAMRIIISPNIRGWLAMLTHHKYGRLSYYNEQQDCCPTRVPDPPAAMTILHRAQCTKGKTDEQPTREFLRYVMDGNEE